MKRQSSRPVRFPFIVAVDSPLDAEHRPPSTVYVWAETEEDAKRRVELYYFAHLPVVVGVVSKRHPRKSFAIT